MKVGIPLGPYRLVRRLATGGMAEIFLARQLGLEGFEKLVVLKRIRPELGEKKSFVTMFLNEARLSAQLNHPNIVQVFELGEHNGALFIAMEHVNGIDLARLASAPHAGEEGPPEYVAEALDLLKVDRIDHGNRALEDATLTARLAREQMALTVCPLSNLRLCGVPSLTVHPLRRMLQAGLKATINSDDPAYFGGYVTENYLGVQQALGLGRDEVVQLARNGFSAAFCDDTLKQRYLAELDAYCQSRG